MATTIQQAIENTHVHYVFIMAYARTRDFAEAKDAADSAARTLTELARLLSSTSPLFQICASYVPSFTPHSKVSPDSSSPRT